MHNFLAFLPAQVQIFPHYEKQLKDAKIIAHKFLTVAWHK
jgi:hypothetical protein